MPGVSGPDIPHEAPHLVEQVPQSPLAKVAVAKAEGAKELLKLVGMKEKACLDSLSHQRNAKILQEEKTFAR